MTTLEQFAVDAVRAGREVEHLSAPDDHDYTTCQCGPCRAVDAAIDALAMAMYKLEDHLIRQKLIDVDPRDEEFEIVEKTVPELS